MTRDDIIRMAREALDLAQDNLRPHGDNCFLRDEGQYDRCFCGKDSLSDYLQSVVEKLDEALAEQPEPQEPVDWEAVAADQAMTIAMMKAEQEAAVLAEREACEALYAHEDVQAPVGNSAWGEAYQDGWIAGAQAYRDAIRARGQA